MVKPLLKDFVKKMQKTNQSELKKLIKKKGDQQNVKLKDRDDYSNRWIETKVLAIQNELFSTAM